MSDKRYQTIKKLIDANKLANFAEIFEIIPPSVAASDLHLNYNSLRKRIEDHSIFTLNEFIRLADLINCDPRVLVDLALINIKKTKKK
ncbi:hypothetical protein GO495_19880 [Chitinophaga oryziterrae]|uniref:XRE family transcriptional regulator n=1 Tax=Chitinophaga oryziterrae TaxID=1031224 RepID=A0A6N8JC49_9BACT|nr:hypothetical protein [Chitinophaga oryziterrae]MVT42865.1 hypothetical protein [Chitinophaga oryziterrae]